MRDATLGPVSFALARHVLALSLLVDIVDVLLELAHRRSRRLLLFLRPSSGAHRHCQVGVVRGGQAAVCLSPRSARQPGRQLGAQLRLARVDRCQLDLRSLSVARLRLRLRCGGGSVAARLLRHARRRQLAHVLSACHAEVVAAVERVLLPRRQVAPLARRAGWLAEARRKERRCPRHGASWQHMQVEAAVLGRDDPRGWRVARPKLSLLFSPCCER